MRKNEFTLKNKITEKTTKTNISNFTMGILLILFSCLGFALIGLEGFIITKVLAWFGIINYSFKWVVGISIILTILNTTIHGTRKNLKTGEIEKF